MGNKKRSRLQRDGRCGGENDWTNELAGSRNGGGRTGYRRRGGRMLGGVTRDNTAAHGGAAAIEQRSLMRGGLGAATQGRGIHRRLHESKADGERE